MKKQWTPHQYSIKNQHVSSCLGTVKVVEIALVKKWRTSKWKFWRWPFINVSSTKMQQCASGRIPVSTFLHLKCVSSGSQHRGAMCKRGQNASRLTAVPSAEYAWWYCAKQQSASLCAEQKGWCFLSRSGTIGAKTFAGYASFDGIWKAVGRHAAHISSTAYPKKLRAAQPLLATDNWLYFFLQ